MTSVEITLRVANPKSIHPELMRDNLVDAVELAGFELVEAVVTGVHGEQAEEVSDSG